MARLVVLLAVLLLAGCFTAGKRGSEPGLAVYDLGLPAAPLIGEERKSPLAVEVRAPFWMDTPGRRIYRLAYADASRLHEYSRVRWAGVPARLIQQRLTQQLGLSSSGQVGALALLLIEINEFSQVFADPAYSKGLLLGRALWLDRSRRQLAERQLEIERPAVSQDSRGGVGALQAAVEQLTADLWAWERQLAANGRIAGCAG